MKKLKTWQWTIILLVLLIPFALAQPTPKPPTYTVEHTTSSPAQDAPSTGYEEGGHTVILIPGRPTEETLEDAMNDGKKVSLVLKVSDRVRHMVRLVGLNTTGVVQNATADIDWYDVYIFDPQTNATGKFILTDLANESCYVWWGDRWAEVTDQISVEKKNETAPGVGAGDIKEDELEEELILEETDSHDEINHPVKKRIKRSRR